MPCQDQSGRFINVGDTVMVPCTVASIQGTGPSPTVTLTTVYKGFDGNTDSIGPVDANQVLENK